MIDAILSILSGGLAGAALVWLLRSWISERLQQSIRHEYSQKLETHKAELNTRIQAIEHENQLYQLRTSLFFDHQRNAFAGLLAKIAEVNQKWIDEEFQSEEGFTGPVPYDAYKELRKRYYEHQLFLDSACLAAMELLFEFYTDSFPFDDGSASEPIPRDLKAAYAGVEYLQPRIAELFQQKIGVIDNSRAAHEVALLGGIRLLNHYHFEEVALPAKGSLELTHRDRPADAVVKAEEHLGELTAKLKELCLYLRRDGGVFHEASTKALRYLSILESE